jgi:acyl-CoA synthetase (AMP-forming)/AMP-acid ligase II
MEKSLNSPPDPADGSTDSFETISDLLSTRARRIPEAVAFIQLRHDGTEEHRITFGDLNSSACCVAASVYASGASGSRVLIAQETSLEFLISYFGCLYAGAVPVPVATSLLKRSPERIARIATDSEAGYALCSDAKTAKSLDFLHTLVPEALTTADKSIGFQPLKAQAVDLALLQYTSGSTSEPRGVMVSHANLLNNVSQMESVSRYPPGCVSVCWLPPHHDMGLIGNMLQSVFNGGCQVLMSPASFAEKPIRWLRAISHYRARVSGSPNFGYQVCVDRTTPEDRAGLDLECWSHALISAEPVRMQTIRQFTEAFQHLGFRLNAFTPAYGLAEATLVACVRRPDEPLSSVNLDGMELERNRVQRCAPDATDCRTLTAAGEVLPGLRVVTVDPEQGTISGEDKIGEIWLQGPGLASGYWGNEEETLAAFCARLPGERGNFLRTGDLGFLFHGQLFVTGRLKDMIVIRGRNIYPQDLEATAETSHPACQVGGAAAFSIKGADDTEAIVIVQEIRRTAESSTGAPEIETAIRASIIRDHHVQVHRVALIRIGTLPRTTSGKVQRRLCRKMFLENTLIRWSSRKEQLPAAPIQAS